MEKITKKQFISGSFWNILEKFSSKGISLVVSIVLARIVAPELHGLISIAALFTNLSDILIDGGFSTALIRKETADEEDFNCVFTISLGLATVCYLIMFFTAPLVAEYYSIPELVAVLRVTGLTFFIQAFSSTRIAIVTRNMQFKFMCYCNILGTLISGVIGIALAYLGFGVWSLVVQRLLQTLLVTAFLFIKIKWKISLVFNFDRFKPLFLFSMGVVGASLLNYLSEGIYGFVIGKQFSVTDLAFYDKGKQFPMQFSLYTFGALSTVLLPTISSCKADVHRVKAIVRKVVNMTAFLILPLMLGMAITSREIIVLLLSDVWEPATKSMQWWSVYYVATPFMLINVQVFFTYRKSFLRVKSEVIRLIIMIATLILCRFIADVTVYDFAMYIALIAVLITVITFCDMKRLIDYRWEELFYDIRKSSLATIVMCVAVFMFGNFCTPKSVLVSFCLKVIVGITVFAVFSIISKSEGYSELKKLLLNILKKRKMDE